MGVLLQGTTNTGAAAAAGGKLKTAAAAAAVAGGALAGRAGAGSIGTLTTAGGSVARIAGAAAAAAAATSGGVEVGGGGGQEGGVRRSEGGFRPEEMEAFEQRLKDGGEPEELLVKTARGVCVCARAFRERGRAGRVLSPRVLDRSRKWLYDGKDSGFGGEICSGVSSMPAALYVSARTFVCVCFFRAFTGRFLVDAFCVILDTVVASLALHRVAAVLEPEFRSCQEGNEESKKRRTRGRAVYRRFWR